MKYRLIQIASGVNANDAITNDIKHIQNLFSSKQTRDFISSTSVYAIHIGENVGFKVRELDDFIANKNDILIIHYSTANPFIQKICNGVGIKILVYHNITPAIYFSKWNLSIAGKQIRARTDLFKLSRCFEISYGVSEFNANELKKIGFTNVKTRPVFVPQSSKNVIEIKTKKNKSLLFVGRLLPNKGIEHLIKSFYFFQNLKPEYQLVLIGSRQKDFSDYFKSISRLITCLGLTAKVTFVDKIKKSELILFYQQAEIFTCLSEHEGFGIPLLEAMFNQLPVIALGNQNSAVAETLNGAGVLIECKKQNDLNVAQWENGMYMEIASLWKVILENEKVRKQIIKKQNLRMNQYNIESINKQFIQDIRGLL